MQTNFSAAQLRDPDNATSERILRKCVHCGFCTATCPTYVLLGDELDSPRGRIYLIKDMLENDRPATEEVVRHVDRCLSCLSCVTTCPSGVDYRHLVDHARVHIERTHRRPLGDRVLRSLLATVLTRPALLRTALRLGRLARPFRAWLPPRLHAMLKLAPVRLPPHRRNARVVHPARGARRLRVALLTGCAQSVVTPDVHQASVRVLRHLGAEVVSIPGCCGALPHHMGREPQGRGLSRSLLHELLRERADGGLDAIVSDASGCGMHVKDFGHQFRGDPLASDAQSIADLARDVTEVIADLGFPETARMSSTPVAYHSACSLQHGQRIDALPRRLLAAAGYDVREIAEGHLCCGSAGTYNVLQPEIAAQLRERKLDNVRRTGAGIIATGNVGCAMHLAVGGEFRVVHTVELLDRALTSNEVVS